MSGAIRVGVEDRCEKFAVSRVADGDRRRVRQVGASSRLRRASECLRFGWFGGVRRCVRPVHDESHDAIISSVSPTTTVQHHDRVLLGPSRAPSGASRFSKVRLRFGLVSGTKFETRRGHVPRRFVWFGTRAQQLPNPPAPELSSSRLHGSTQPPGRRIPSGWVEN